MSMEINGGIKYYKTDYADQLKAENEKLNESKNVSDNKKISDNIPVPHDEYISSEEAVTKPSGLYRLEQDKDGNKKVFFDDPKKQAKKCTTDTDKVDKEIKKLKEKKQQLEQQIKSASGDKNKLRELEKKLAQVESELSQKDNDTYRRQNAVVS